MVQISAGILRAIADHIELPKYPEESLESRKQGTVILRVVVDESGKVVLATPEKGEALLIAGRLEGLRDSRFHPYLLGGKPIKVESEVGFQFSIKGRGEKDSGNVEYLSSFPSQLGRRTGMVTDQGVVILSPQRISGAEPRLPTDLAGKQGSVYLTVIIGVDGRVQDVTVISGDKAFINSVVTAVKQFRYEPELVDGKPSIATTQLRFHFGPKQ
jgi:TonB family protein